MKKGLILLTAAIGLATARAEVVLEESFTYDDGPIIVQAADTWKNTAAQAHRRRCMRGSLS